MADRKALIERLWEAFDPFRRVLALHEPLGLPDDRPLREIMPGAWPTLGELRAVAESLAPLSPPATTAGEEKVAWRCFHCGEVFTDESCARVHFGPDEDSKPACLIKAGAEGSLVRALREAEQAAADAWAAIHSESTEAARAYYAQTTRHQKQITAAEELGYERGLADGRALTSSPDLREQVEGLRELSEQATQGDWKVGGSGIFPSVMSNDGFAIAASGMSKRHVSECKVNAKLIVAAVNLVRAALAQGREG